MASPLEMDLSIESFRGDTHDKSEIAATHLAIRRWQEEVGENEFSNILESQTDLRAIDDYYVKPGGNFFVATDSEHELIGFLGLKKDGPSRGAIKRLSVVLEHRRKGVATALTKSAIGWAKFNGFSELHLATNKGEKARPIYERFGFTVVGFDEKSEDWLMTLELSGPAND